MEPGNSRRFSIKDILKSNDILFHFFLLASRVQLYLTNSRFTDEQYLKRIFNRYHDYELDLENPKTLNEKLQWLKLHERKDYQTKYADKYAVREFLANTFGEEYVVPLVFHTTDYRELKLENLPYYPVVIKTNHGCGNSVMVRDKSIIDFKKLRIFYKRLLQYNYYYSQREWQYKNIEPRIIVEKMLYCKDGKVPNDYKLNFIEGKLEFIYVSVDREGTNKRNIYSPEWSPMYFTWTKKGKDISKIRGEEIQPPLSLPKMIEFGTIIARLYKYVRVDFYDVDGVLYFGEITRFHGSGFDQMLPFEFDLKFGEKINPLTN